VDVVRSRRVVDHELCHRPSGPARPVALPVLALFMLLQGGIPPTSLALPLLLLVQLLLTLGIGCALCAANVFFRDVRLFVDVSLLLGFYLTPVFYDVETVPEQYRFVFDLNPMSHLLEAYREVLIAGQLPSTGTTAVLVAVSVTVFVVGLRIFEATSHAFLDEL
jgi:lipopolysaccharide transport system permease protein